MTRLNFDEYEIELVNESLSTADSVGNISAYELVYRDEESEFYRSTDHAIKVYKDEKLYKSALVCAVGGATGIHENSAVIIDEDILICCADTVFRLSLPELKLNWLRQVDEATCFRICNTANGLFVHGEISVSRIDQSGNIIWSQSFADILVTPDGKDEFIMHKDFIEIEDWQHNKYKLSFDGKII